MARTPLASKVQDAVSAVAEAAERKVPVEQVLEERTTRRELLKRAGAVGVAAAGASTAAKAARAPARGGSPRRPSADPRWGRRLHRSPPIP